MENDNVKSLLKRIDIFMEEDQWSTADKYCERVLDIDPENSEAYLKKIYIKYRTHNEEEFFDIVSPKIFEETVYQRYIKYANKGDVVFFNNRVKAKIYNSASNYLSEKDFFHAKELFETIEDFKDSKEKIDICIKERDNKNKELENKISKILKIAVPILILLVTVIILLNANFTKRFFADIDIKNGNYKKAISLLEKIEANDIKAKDMLNYATGIELYNSNAYELAVSKFKNNNYRDSATKYYECKYQNAIHQWNAGDLRKAYYDMKDVYKQDPNFMIDNKSSAREYLAIWVKEKDKISLIGDEYICKSGPMKPTATFFYDYRSPAVSTADTNSQKVRSFKITKVINNKICGTAEVEIKLGKSGDFSDYRKSSLKKTIDFSFDFGSYPQVKENRFTNDGDLGHINITMISDTTFIVDIVGNVHYPYSYSLHKAYGVNGQVDTDQWTVTMCNARIIDTVQTFIDYSNLKEGLNGDQYKKTNGQIATNEWIEDNGEYYFFNSDGLMEKNKWIDTDYYVGADGKMLKDTKTPDGYYVGSDGKYLKNTWTKEGIYVNSDGKCVTNGWINNEYYADSNGQILKNTTTPDGYYVGEDGKRIITEAIPFKYDNAYSFSEGLASVKQNGKYGYIDKTGKENIPLEYFSAYSFSEGLAVVDVRKDVIVFKNGYIDKSGNEVIPSKYDFAFPFSDGIASVELNGKYGCIDKNGNEVIPIKYDFAQNFSEGLVKVKMNGKYGYIDKTGKEVIPLKYDFIYGFSEGLVAVKQNNKYSYIDKNGKEVTPFIYDDASEFTEGLARVKKNGKYGYIDKNGKEVIAFIYDNAIAFSEGLARVEQNGKWGFIDKNGTEVIQIKYDGGEPVRKVFVNVNKCKEFR